MSTKRATLCPVNADTNVRDDAIDNTTSGVIVSGGVGITKP